MRTMRTKLSLTVFSFAAVLCAQSGSGQLILDKDLPELKIRASVQVVEGDQQIRHCDLPDITLIVEGDSNQVLSKGGAPAILVYGDSNRVDHTRSVGMLMLKGDENTVNVSSTLKTLVLHGDRNNVSYVREYSMQDPIIVDLGESNNIRRTVFADPE